MPVYSGNLGDFAGMANAAALSADAKNRALRTFLTGLAIDVLVGVTLVLVTYFATAESWGTIEWAVLSFSVAKSFVQAAGAFILRRFIDASKVPTPLPPADPGEPDDEAGVGELQQIALTAAGVALGIAIVLVLARLF